MCWLACKVTRYLFVLMFRCATITDQCAVTDHHYFRVTCIFYLPQIIPFEVRYFTWSSIIDMRGHDTNKIKLLRNLKVRPSSLNTFPVSVYRWTHLRHTSVSKHLKFFFFFLSVFSFSSEALISAVPELVNTAFAAWQTVKDCITLGSQKTWRSQPMRLRFFALAKVFPL